jgi:hypothetical protein
VLGYGKRAENGDALLKRLYRKSSIIANQAADLLAVTLAFRHFIVIQVSE